MSSAYCEPRSGRKIGQLKFKDKEPVRVKGRKSTPRSSKEENRDPTIRELYPGACKFCPKSVPKAR
jgi:hypothetical protein